MRRAELYRKLKIHVWACMFNEWDMMKHKLIIRGLKHLENYTFLTPRQKYDIVEHVAWSTVWDRRFKKAFG